MSVFKRWNGTSWETIGPQISSTRFDDTSHMIAPEYSSTDIYNVGDYVVQSDKLYKCISAIESAEEWTPAHWTQVSISGEVSDLNSTISELSNVLVDVISNETTLSLLAQQIQKVLTPGNNGNITDGALSSQNVYAFDIQGYDSLHFNFYSRISGEAYYAFYNAQELSGCSSETIIGTVTAYAGAGVDNYVNQIPVGAKTIVIAARSEGMMRGITKTVVSKVDTNLADTYSGSHVYYVGDYCTYNGNVYRRIIYTGNAEAWDETKWEQIKPTTAIQQNTNRFAERNYFDSDLFQIGTVNSYGEIITNQRYRIVNTDLIHITEVTTIDVDALYDCTIYYYKSDGTYRTNNGGVKTYQYLTILPDSYVRFVIRKIGSTETLQNYQIRELAHAISFTSAYTKQNQTIQNNSVGTMNALEAKIFQKGASPVSFDKYPCILVAGQSNIDGRVPSSSLPSSITPPFSNIKNNIGKTNGVFATEMTLPSSFGIDFSLYAALNNLNTPWYVIKRSLGGTSISPSGDSTSHWTPFYEELDDISKSLLYTFHRQIAKCEDVNPATFDFRALIWQQGEGDRASTSKYAALNYYKNFKCLIAYIRGITRNETLPVVCGTVSHLSGQYDPTVEEATLRVASEDPYITCIDMSGAQLLDAFHFDADSAIYFGYKAYDALIDFGVVSGTKINPTRPW